MAQVKQKEDVKEKPILFSTEMIQAILDERKTQTRRVMKPQPKKDEDGFWKFADAGWNRDSGSVPVMPGHSMFNKCPYGADELWVRESFYFNKQFDRLPPSKVREGAKIWYETNRPLDRSLIGKKRPSIFMPRWASRIQLTITDIGVERVQDITAEDAIAEGITCPFPSIEIQKLEWQPKEAFKDLWDSINADRGYPWADNPWVWVVAFEVKNIRT